VTTSPSPAVDGNGQSLKNPSSGASEAENTSAPAAFYPPPKIIRTPLSSPSGLP